MLGFNRHIKHAPARDMTEPVPEEGVKRLLFLLHTHFSKLVLVNLLFLALCVPIVTAPAALCALNRVLIKLVRDGNCFLAYEFFKEFRVSFKKALALGLLFAVLFGFTYYCLSLYVSNKNMLYSLLFGVLGLLPLPFSVLLSSYTFILLPMLNLPARRILSNALRIIMLDRGRALGVLGLCVVFFAFFMLLFPFCLMLVTVCGVSLSQLMLCAIVNTPVQKYIIAPFEAEQPEGK